MENRDEYGYAIDDYEYEEFSKDIDKMTEEILFYYNWNRIAYLQARGNLSNMDRTEIKLRIEYQNTHNVQCIKNSLTNEVINSVKYFIMEVEKNEC